MATTKQLPKRTPAPFGFTPMEPRFGNSAGVAVPACSFQTQAPSARGRRGPMWLLLFSLGSFQTRSPLARGQRGLRLRCCSLGPRISNRVLRGGSFNNNASNVRSANRNTNQPDNRNNNNGFRVSSTLPCRNSSGCPVSTVHQRSVPGCKVHRRPVSGRRSSHWRIAVRPNEKPIRRVW